MKILTIMIGLIGAIATLSLSSAAAMNGIDLQNCRTQSGTPINPQLCEKLRISEAREVERKKSERAWNEDQARRRQQEALQRAEDREKDKERTTAMDEQRARNQAALDAEWDKEKKKRLAEEAKEERQDRARAAQRSINLRTKKELCGEDFGTPRIGMTLARAQQCVGSFKLSSQINRADGVISMYVGGGFYLHVMQGNIVAWTR